MTSTSEAGFKISPNKAHRKL